jgi:GDP-4-dehydro-6-deoxy-D-mannose reductase
MKVLITGITGMIGTHFARECRSRGWETVGIARNSADSRLAAIPDPSVIRCDVLDQEALFGVVSKVRPDIIAHFAAQAFNGASWQFEESTYHTNVFGTLNLLRAARTVCPGARVLLACSSAEYGDVTPEECPLVEERPLRPVSPYGASKVAAECLGYQYFSNYGLGVYLPRLFIHVGTGHPPATALQNFARQLALISRRVIDPVLRVGCLDTARDFVDVRDGVRAMLTLLEYGKPGVPVNICTGVAHRIADCLDILIDISGLKVEVIPDAALLRPSDEVLLLGDSSKLRALGWRPECSFRRTLEGVYADWLARI